MSLWQSKAFAAVAGSVINEKSHLNSNPLNCMRGTLKTRLLIK